MGKIRITGLEPRAVTEPTLKAAYERIDDPKMQDGNAFFSRQTFQINGKNVTVRVYYADSAAFKEMRDIGCLDCFIIKLTSDYCIV